MLETAFRLSCMNRASVFEWHKRFKESRESVSDDESVGGVRKSEHQSLLAKGLGLGLLCGGLKGVQEEIPSKETRILQTAFQWHFHQDIKPVHNSILVTDYLTMMGVKTVPHSSIVQTLHSVTFGYSLSSEAVVMRQLRR